MSSDFSEDKGLWALLTLEGLQNLSQVDLILYLNAFDFFLQEMGRGVTKVHYWQCENDEQTNRLF